MNFEDSHLTRYQIFDRVRLSAARILYQRDPRPNRTAAYHLARDKAERIALRNMRALDAKAGGFFTTTAQGALGRP